MEEVYRRRIDDGYRVITTYTVGSGSLKLILVRLSFTCSGEHRNTMALNRIRIEFFLFVSHGGMK